MDVETFILARREMYSNRFTYSLALLGNIILLPALIPAILLTMVFGAILAKFKKDDVDVKTTKQKTADWDRYHNNYRR